MQRSQIDDERDKAYAEYWLAEYGVSPDKIRNESIFPVIQDRLAPYARGGVIYDFGCGVGNAVPFCRGLGAAKYVGFDVNQYFLEAAESAYADNSTSFIRKNFDQAGWERSLTSTFDLGLSIFVLNELKNQRSYLSGIKTLCRRGSKSTRIKESEKSRLALIITHPFLVIKDLSDFYLSRTNSRKFENIETYKSSEQGRYEFSRGDFSIPYHHLPLGSVFDLVIQCGFKLEYYEEIFFGSAEQSDQSYRTHVDNQFPKALLLILKG